VVVAGRGRADQAVTYRACKDIPDETFLTAVDETIRLRSGVEACVWGVGATRWDLAAVLAGRPGDVGGSSVDWLEMPQKLLLAKAAKLIRRGLLTGCVCGCRGGFDRPRQIWDALIPVAVAAYQKLSRR
jgi:hypothetical protein